MRMCKEHWGALRDKLDAAGLSQFISSGGEEAEKRMVEGGFDPLINAHNAIVNNALGTKVGPAVMMPNEDGSERCPLCFLIKGCPCDAGEKCPFRTWMDRAVADQLDEAKRRGLVAIA